MFFPQLLKCAKVGESKMDHLLAGSAPRTVENLSGTAVGVQTLREAAPCLAEW